MSLFKKRESPNVGDRLRHIAFIMDGNGRWALRRGLPREAGHSQGAANMKKIVRHCGDIGIKYITIYTFSTENWSRPKREVDAIMKLLDDYITEGVEGDAENNIEYVFIGDKAPLPPDIRTRAEELEKLTRGNGKRLNIALNYGGRAEIVHAVNELIAEGASRVTEEAISGKLYTAGCPEPDLIIRTGCELRLSNFLTWQSVYSELYFTDTLWPALTPREVDAAVAEFLGRKRRFGGL